MDPANSSSAMDLAKYALSIAASVATSAVVARAFVNQYLPFEVREYINYFLSSFLSFLMPPSSILTIVIHEFKLYRPNEMFTAAMSYLNGKMSPTTKRLRVYKHISDRKMLVTVDRDEVVKDVFEGVEYSWCLRSRDGRTQSKFNRDEGEEVRFLELSFHRRHHHEAMESYLPHLVERWKAIKEGDRQIQLYLLRQEDWNSVSLDHPATFDTLAMDPDLKNMMKGDLERFVRRRDYYRQVGKAWKRGYLLYGPPGTGKSSLIAAMANFLKFDVYDLELTEVTNNTSLRTVLMGTANRSILVVEDIDCSIQLKARSAAEDGSVEKGTKPPPVHQEVQEGGITLSGVLNMIDGLMSSCGDERIIVFTTNHKDRLDPALLRPGRMDLHIHMSYCTVAGFGTLAQNYHGVKCHRLFPEIERLIGEVVDVTPAEVTGELMKSEECDEAFDVLLRFLQEKTKDPKRRKGRAEAEEG